MDLDSVSKLTAALEAHGIPNLQIVYFPGIIHLLISPHNDTEKMASNSSYFGHFFHIREGRPAII